MQRAKSPIPPQGGLAGRLLAGAVYLVGFYVVALFVIVIVGGWFVR